MSRRKRTPMPVYDCEPSPPCAECGRESDDTIDGRRFCGECNPEYSAEHRAMLYAMRLGAWQPYIRPIFASPAPRSPKTAIAAPTSQREEIVACEARVVRETDTGAASAMRMTTIDAAAPHPALPDARPEGCAPTPRVLTAANAQTR